MYDNPTNIKEYPLKTKSFWKSVFAIVDVFTFQVGPTFLVNFGYFLRYRISRHISKGIQKGAHICKHAKIVPGVVIEERGNAGINCMTGWGVHIGKDVMMGHNCAMFTQSHLRSDDNTKFKLGWTKPKPIYIGDNSWIGHNVIILPGVHIGKGCTIGAGSVVTKDVPDYCLAAGNPAVIKKRYVEK